MHGGGLLFGGWGVILEGLQYSWVLYDVINFSGVNSKSRHRHGSELDVHCMCWPRVS